MTSPAFIVTSLPFGAGVDAARALAEACKGVAVWLPPAADLAERLRHDSRPLLLVTEAPQSALAHWLASGTAGDPHQAMAQWSTAAAAWVRHLPGRAVRWMAIDLDEARHAPQALLAALRESFDKLSSVQLPSLDHVLPSLERMVAAGAVVRDHGLRRQADALLALCSPFAAEPVVAGPTVERELGAAVQALRAMRAQAAHATVLDEKLRGVDEARSVAESAQRVTRERLDVVEQENSLLVEQLLRAQEAWDSALDRARTAESALAEERAAWRDAQSRHELQLAQFQQRVQAALAAGKMAEASANVGQHSLLRRIGFDVLRVLGEDPTPTHRQLALELQGFRIDGQPALQAEVRLVEHHGQGGLAWLAAPAGAPPFLNWQAVGAEQGKPYMLLIPGDESTWPAFEALAATDWHVVLQVVALLAVRMDDDEQLLSWQSIARRVAIGVMSRPACLRYDQARAQGDASRGQLELQRVTFGPATWAGCSLRWEMRAGRTSLHIELQFVQDGLPSTWPLRLEPAPEDAALRPLTAALAATLPRALSALDDAGELVPRLQRALAPPAAPAQGLAARLRHRLRSVRRRR